MSEQIVFDLALFADLGTDAPHAVTTTAGTVIRMIRHGKEIQLAIRPDGSVDENDLDGERHYIDVRALLASPGFGDLGRWAEGQKSRLKAQVEEEKIPVLGVLSETHQPTGLDAVDALLVRETHGDQPAVRVLLIDGPAGIGKTGIIRSLAYSRAINYRLRQRPLVLHVESRGRMLQNIMDLMAFSLQTLRLNVTYDQVPILVRYGLVTLAIDGFDELGDPNGYELAWAQVNDLLSAVRGRGSLILAGRETFIGRDRLEKALKSFRGDVDRLDTYTIRGITPQDAKDWLRNHGWSEQILEQDNVEPLFESGSYALRPFFLQELTKDGVVEQIEKGEIGDLTWFLVDAMLRREAAKFGRDVEAETTEHQRIEFVRRFLGEVARDLADNQTESIAVDSLMWIAELTASETLPPSVLGIVKNRAGVVAFLTEDDRVGHRRFSHAQLLNHFLGRISIDAITKGEVPKYIRRNIFGADFLSGFSEVVRNTPDENVVAFVNAACGQIGHMTDLDRARRNLASLVLAAMGAIEAEEPFLISDVAIDEAIVAETAGPLSLKNVTIAQLDARAADLRNFVFDESCHVISLMADAGTALPSSFPRPRQVQLPDRVLMTPIDIGEWLRNSMRDERTEGGDGIIPAEARSHPLLELLGRVSRYKPFWIRDGDEKAARRILDHEYWEAVRGLLERHNLLTTRTIAASGRPSSFFHVRKREAILAQNTQDPDIHAFYRDVIRKIQAQAS